MGSEKRNEFWCMHEKLLDDRETAPTHKNNKLHNNNNKADVTREEEGEEEEEEQTPII